MRTSTSAVIDISRGPKDHANRRLLHPGCRGQEKGDSRSHSLQDPGFYISCTICRILCTIYSIPH